MSSKKSERLEAAAWLQLELVNSWIRHSDAKLTALLALISVAGGGVYALAQGGCGRPAILVSAAAAGVFLAGAAIFVFIGLLPRRRLVVSDRSEVVFYRAITSLYTTADDYATAFADAVRHDTLSANLLRQTRINAGIADRKFVMTTWSVVLLILGLAALATCALIGVLADANAAAG